MHQDALALFDANGLTSAKAMLIDRGIFVTEHPVAANGARPIAMIARSFQLNRGQHRAGIAYTCAAAEADMCKGTRALLVARGRRLVMTPTRSPIEAADVLVRHSDSRQRFCRLMRVGRRLRRPLAFRMTRSRSRCRQGADSPPIPSGSVLGTGPTGISILHSSQNVCTVPHCGTNYVV